MVAMNTLGYFSPTTLLYLSVNPPFLLGPLPLCDVHVPRDERIDCGWNGVTKQQCEAKGCCYDDSWSHDGAPYCFYAAGISIPEPSKLIIKPSLLLCH